MVTSAPSHGEGEHHCRLDRCGPHQLLAEDHAVLNRLLFVRHILERLQREEHMLKSGSHQIAEAAG